MSPVDGRVVSNFIMQAIKGEPLTIYGDGEQTRSFQYVHDLIDGLILLMNSDYSEPVNLGNPDEYTIKEFANTIRDMVLTAPLSSQHGVDVVTLPAVKDDPKKRKPDITRAKTEIGWEPRFSVKQGLQETVDWFKAQVAEGAI
jgi:UDP-glucuronate decarboxylase